MCAMQPAGLIVCAMQPAGVVGRYRYLMYLPMCVCARTARQVKDCCLCAAADWR